MSNTLIRIRLLLRTAQALAYRRRFDPHDPHFTMALRLIGLRAARRRRSSEIAAAMVRAARGATPNCSVIAEVPFNIIILPDGLAVMCTTLGTPLTTSVVFGIDPSPGFLTVSLPLGTRTCALVVYCVYLNKALRLMGYNEFSVCPTDILELN